MHRVITILLTLITACGEPKPDDGSSGATCLEPGDPCTEHEQCGNAMACGWLDDPEETVCYTPCWEEMPCAQGRCSKYGACIDPDFSLIGVCALD